MRLEDDPETAFWLDRLTGDAEDFDWDEGNQTKHAKHGVAPTEIEAMLRHPLLFAGRIVEPSHSEPRWLALIFTRRGEKLRPVSGRPMRRKERSVYEEGCRQVQASTGSTKR